jgi:hypothetical protein
MVKVEGECVVCCVLRVACCAHTRTVRRLCSFPVVVAAGDCPVVSEPSSWRDLGF